MLLRDKNGSEIKSQTKSTGFPEFLCSEGETEDVKISFSNFSFETASLACGSKGRGGGTDRGRHVSLPNGRPLGQAEGGPTSPRQEQLLEAPPSSAGTQAPPAAHVGAEAPH